MVISLATTVSLYLFLKPEVKEVSPYNEFQSKYKMPCLQGTDTELLDPTKIGIRVLNATDKSGFGQIVTDALKLRGFQVQPPSNSTKSIGITYIEYGKKAINYAFSTSLFFDKPLMIMDDRNDQLIDINIDNDFTNITSKELITKIYTDKLLPPLQGCVASNKIKKVKAPKHTIWHATKDSEEQSSDETDTTTDTTTVQ